MVNKTNSKQFLLDKIDEYRNRSRNKIKELNLFLLGIGFGILGNIFASSIFGLAEFSTYPIWIFYVGMLIISGIGFIILEILIYLDQRNERNFIAELNRMYSDINES